MQLQISCTPFKSLNELQITSTIDDRVHSVLPFLPLAFLPQCWVSSAYYVQYIVCVSVRSRWIVSDRQYFTIRLALLMIYLLTSSSLPGANQWKYFCLFTQCPNSSFQIHFWLFDSDSDSDSDLVFTCVRTFHTLCGHGSARYCFLLNNWTINWNVCAESEMKLKKKLFGEKTEKNRKTKNV